MYGPKLIEALSSTPPIVPAFEAEIYESRTALLGQKMSNIEQDYFT
jgi:hypothetical protein